MEDKMYEIGFFGEPIRRDAPRRPLETRFGFPPFTVLDARSGQWQSRKKAWVGMGIRSELGRDAETYGTSKWVKDQNFYGSFPPESALNSGTSIFDPVLCECVYRWFCPPGGQIVDPFAGGSVRGIVAGSLGRPYWGVDLRHEQVVENADQADKIQPTVPPTWVSGDSRDKLAEAPPADFVFSCPPYGDLERYSDDPSDLSTMNSQEFMVAYRAIIRESLAVLKPDRFACFVVGDYRDKQGYYRNFVSDTIASFEDAGARLYNEAILVTVAGTAAMRVTKQFQTGRKMAKTHQNVLVFCKGDWKKATLACGDVE